MNPKILKFTAEAKATFEASFGSFADAIEKARKSKDDNGTFDVIISTEENDRSGEIIMQDGLELENYNRNPIVLWGHDYSSMPIGIATEIYKTTYNGKKATGARGVFLPADVNPFAQQVRKLYDFGYTSGVGTTTSVGFIPKEFDPTNMYSITKWELLEFSFVPVPCNQGVGAAPAQARALTFAAAKALGMDAELLVKGGVEFAEVKGAEVGAHCELDDGAPGVLADDPKNPGVLVCVPQDEDKSAKVAKAAAEEALHSALDGEHARHGGIMREVLKAFADGAETTDEEAKKAFDIEKSMDVLRKAMTAEHGTHMEKMLECFKAYTPGGKKGEDDGEEDEPTAISDLENEHDRHGEVITKAIDAFAKKFENGVEGGDNDAIDWIYGKLDRENGKHENTVKTIAKAYCASMSAEKSVAVKAGARLSQTSKDAITEAHQLLKSAVAILEQLHGALEQGEGDEGDGNADGNIGDKNLPGNEGRKAPPAGLANARNELQARIAARELVRGISASVNTELANINESIREYYKSRNTKK